MGNTTPDQLELVQEEWVQEEWEWVLEETVQSIQWALVLAPLNQK